MNRTIKEATVKRYHYDSQQQLDTHLRDFIDAYNYGHRLKTLRGLTPFEYICKIWTIEPERFTLDPTHQMPRLNTSIGSDSATAGKMLRRRRDMAFLSPGGGTIFY